ncbi:hypothetical protein J6590_061458 [Homalodisca vitripennis]|nr:hypothetical protein J6590_061458 [Homalodisca vitripennis]
MALTFQMIYVTCLGSYTFLSLRQIILRITNIEWKGSTLDDDDKEVEKKIRMWYFSVRVEQLQSPSLLPGPVYKPLMAILRPN